MDRMFDLLGAIVGVAMITTIVAHKGTAGDINAASDFFNGALHNAMNLHGG
jgi:hypothetical protein